MTKTIGASLLAHFGATTTSLAYCWKITLTNGDALYFTSHDQDIVYAGHTYIASSGFVPTDIAQKDDFSVSNMDVIGFFNAGSITEPDIAAGLFDYAEIEIFIVNYDNIAQGRVLLKKGWVGELSYHKNSFTAEVRGVSQKLSQRLTQMYSPTCRADFGDTRCKKNAASFTSTASVTSFTDARQFKASALTQANSYFTNGVVTWTTGPNTGLTMEVRDFRSTEVWLTQSMPYSIAVGHQFSIVAGCDKVFSTCKDKFNNIVNFRGEPHVPGMDKILETSGTFTNETG